MYPTYHQNGTGKKEEYENKKLAMEALSRMQANFMLIKNAGFNLSMTLVTPGGVKEVRVIHSLDLITESESPNIFSHTEQAEIQNKQDDNSDPQKCDT